jgi:spore coat polysaccharide biosynthesis protein SpsF (cytidylyltransferase family)
MRKIPRRRVCKPTQEEIASCLAELNSESKRSARTHQARIAKGLAIHNHLEWFKIRRVPVYKDKKTRMWVLGWPSDF